MQDLHYKESNRYLLPKENFIHTLTISKQNVISLMLKFFYDEIKGFA